MKLYNGRWRYCNVFFVKKLVNNTSNKCLKNDWVRSNQQLNFDKTISLVPSWLVIDSHYECISAYTSKTYIVQYHKKRWDTWFQKVKTIKKDFIWLYCLFCGKRCHKKDPREASRCFFAKRRIRIADGNITLFDLCTRHVG